MPVPEEAVEVKPRGYWAPNTESPTPLKCGCLIPWPIVQLIGTAPGNPHRVWCDKHGWTDVREEDPQCKTTQSTLPDIPPF